MSPRCRRAVLADRVERAIESIDLVADPFASGHVRGSAHPGCGKLATIAGVLSASRCFSRSPLTHLLRKKSGGCGVSCGRATVAISKRVCTIRAAGMIVAALVASVAGTSRDAHAQVPSPSVTSISPNSGPTAGGTPVTITGNNFTGATAVRFGGTAATSFTVNSATAITATAPAGSGTVDVTVTNSSGTSATNAVDQFTYGLVATTTALSSSKDPSSFGQSVTFTAKVTGFSPTGTVTFFDGGMQIGTGTLAAGTATFTTSSLAVGSHSITAKYGGDPNNVAGTSAALTQTVSVPTDSIKLREMQISVTPMIAQISGQAIVGAIDSAIDAGFSDNPQALVPNGGGFTFQIPLGQPAADIGSVG